eukprot:Clim_evm5s15 gene=Clim_evmTU5s15
MPRVTRRSRKTEVAKSPQVSQEIDDMEKTIHKLLAMVRCAICWADVPSTPVSTPCGHFYCKECISHALQNRQVCPICSEKITKRSLREAGPQLPIFEALRDIQSAIDKDKLVIREDGPLPTQTQGTPSQHRTPLQDIYSFNETSDGPSTLKKSENRSVKTSRKDSGKKTPGKATARNKRPAPKTENTNNGSKKRTGLATPDRMISGEESYHTAADHSPEDDKASRSGTVLGSYSPVAVVDDDAGEDDSLLPDPSVPKPANLDNANDPTYAPMGLPSSMDQGTNLNDTANTIDLDKAVTGDPKPLSTPTEDLGIVEPSQITSGQKQNNKDDDKDEEDGEEEDESDGEEDSSEISDNGKPQGQQWFAFWAKSVNNDDDNKEVNENSPVKSKDDMPQKASLVPSQSQPSPHEKSLLHNAISHLHTGSQVIGAVGHRLGGRRKTWTKQDDLVFMCSGLTDEQTVKVRKFADHVNADVESSDYPNTSHLIMNEPLRTWKFLHCAALRCKIMSFKWIEESLSAQQLLPETTEGAALVMKGVDGCEDGPSNIIREFNDLDNNWVRPKPLFGGEFFFFRPQIGDGDIKVSDLQLLIEEAGGEHKLTGLNPIKHALVYYIDDANTSDRMILKRTRPVRGPATYQVQVVSIEWFLDSITAYQRLDLSAYKGSRILKQSVP